jgi:hypothetical protein
MICSGPPHSHGEKQHQKQNNKNNTEHTARRQQATHTPRSTRTTHATSTHSRLRQSTRRWPSARPQTLSGRLTGGASLEQHAALLAGGRGGLQRGENGLVKDVLQALLREGRALDVLDRPQLCRQLIASVGGDGLLLELGHLRRAGDERLTSEMAVVCGHFC